MKFNNSENIEAIRLTDEGSFFLSSKEYEKAIEKFKEALSLDSEYTRTYYNLGQAYFLINEMNKAIEIFETMEKLQKESYIPNYNMGNIYLLNGDLENAIKNYDKAIEKGCNEPKVYLTLSKVYEALGNEILAKENYIIGQSLK